MGSIKPPDGRVPPTAVPSASGAGSAAETPAADFRDALSAAERAGAAQAVSPSGASAADPIGELSRLVKSGALSADQALDQLVERTLATVGRSLNATQRGELERVLRSALEADPTLRALRDGLSG
jgi:hypothetical protein